MNLDNLTPTIGGWLAVSLAALFFSALNLQVSLGDLRAAKLVKNYRQPTRMLIARGAVHRNWVKVGVFGWWTFLGLLFGLFDPPEVLGLAGFMGLIVTAGAMAYIGYHETRERHSTADLLADDIADDLRDGQDEHDADIAQATVRAADRMGRAMQQTAENTERIAKNTEPEESK